MTSTTGGEDGEEGEDGEDGGGVVELVRVGGEEGPPRLTVANVAALPM